MMNVRKPVPRSFLLYISARILCLLMAANSRLNLLFSGKHDVSRSNGIPRVKDKLVSLEALALSSNNLRQCVLFQMRRAKIPIGLRPTENKPALGIDTFANAW